MLLSVSDVSKAFAADIVLSGVSLRVEPGEKVALVGRNGTGKTTLLKIITGQMEPDSGSVHLSRGAKIGYLRQEVPVDSGKTVLGEAEQAKERVLQMRARLDELESRFGSDPTADDLEEYAVLHEHFLDQQGYSAERDLEIVLQRMGFSKEEFGKSASTLSGGEKTRLALARMLLEEPDLMILDEPTNHLDLEATEWLESWLRNYRGAALIVSHDREFLQNVSQRIVEMRSRTTRSWPGPFDKYLKLREEDEARQTDLAKRQQQEMAKLDEFVRRFLNSERVAQARGRQRHLNRMKANIIEAPKQDKGMKGAFATAKRSGDVVLECKKLTMGFSNAPLFANLDWTVMRGERWGVIGENGAGKSTLVRVALGLLEPISGNSRIGANVSTGFFAQDTGELDPKLTPLELLTYESGMEIPSARSLLGRFLFSGEQVFQPIGTLSGGEKNKLALARLTALHPNFLVLDEPTNHLDFDSREALAEILQEFAGTIVLVSHDRWLLTQLTNKTLDVRHDGVRQFPGSYAVYRSGRQPVVEQQAETKAQKTEPKLSQRGISKEITRLSQLVAALEGQIEEKEIAVAKHEDRLATLQPEADFVAETKRHDELQKELAVLLSNWEQETAALEKVSQLQGAAKGV